MRGQVRKVTGGYHLHHLLLTWFVLLPDTDFVGQQLRIRRSQTMAPIQGSDVF